MRANEIKIGEDYAIVRSRGKYYLDSAVRATVVGRLQDGSWRVHFSEPVVRLWGTYKALSAMTGGHTAVSISKDDVESRHLVAQWDQYLEDRIEDKRQKEMVRKLQDLETDAIKAQIEEIKAMLTKLNCTPNSPDQSGFTVSQGWTYIGGESKRSLQINLPCDQAATLLRALENPSGESSALGSLLNPS